MRALSSVVLHFQGASKILGALLRPTCVLAEPAQKIPLKSGASELWFPVEVPLEGTPTKGWMHRIREVLEVVDGSFLTLASLSAPLRQETTLYERTSPGWMPGW